MNGYFQEINKNMSLTTNESNKIIKKTWRTVNLISSITKNSDDYDKK